MEATMLVLVLIIGLVALGWASLNWGVDTREPYRDDHTR
jgi:nitrogen fixation-related uncharacterized protein